MKRLIPVLGVAILIVLLVFVNKGISHTAHPDDDDDDTAQSTPQKTPKPALATPAPGQSPEIAPEISVGDPTKAKHKITVGWIYDETNQPNPQALAAALQAVQQAAQASNGTLSAEIVDLDVPTSELSPLAPSVAGLGVAVDGVAVGPSENPGAPGLTDDVIVKALPK